MANDEYGGEIAVSIFHLASTRISIIFEFHAQLQPHIAHRFRIKCSDCGMLCHAIKVDIIFVFGNIFSIICVVL